MQKRQKNKLAVVPCLSGFFKTVRLENHAQLSALLILHGSFLSALAQWLLGLVPCSRWPAGQILWSLLKAPPPFPAVPCNLFYWRMQESEHFCEFGFQVFHYCFIMQWLTNLPCALMLARDSSRALNLSHRSPQVGKPIFLALFDECTTLWLSQSKTFFFFSFLYFLAMISVHCLPTQASLALFCFDPFSTSVHLGSAGSRKVNSQSHIRQYQTVFFIVGSQEWTEILSHSWQVTAL